MLARQDWALVDGEFEDPLLVEAAVPLEEAAWLKPVLIRATVGVQVLDLVPVHGPVAPTQFGQHQPSIATYEPHPLR